MRLSEYGRICKISKISTGRNACPSPLSCIQQYFPVFIAAWTYGKALHMFCDPKTLPAENLPYPQGQYFSVPGSVLDCSDPVMDKWALRLWKDLFTTITSSLETHDPWKNPSSSHFRSPCSVCFHVEILTLDCLDLLQNLRRVSHYSLVSLPVHLLTMHIPFACSSMYLVRV
jgi:hypothetical protein